MRKTQLALALCALGMSGTALATNGMNLEGYGPIAAAMGGASMAYDNGTAAVMNNPATLGLMEQGSRLDIAIGMLGPDVSSKVGGNSANSGGDAYYMPAIGWAKKNGAMSYGVAMFAQGGMGTEYERGSAADLAGSPNKQRSELGVGRLILPLTYDVSPALTVGGSIDFVWAMMDLQMVLRGDQFLGLTNPASPYGSVGGSMVAGLGGMIGSVIPAPSDVNWGYFDFSDSSDYTGKAKTTGFAGKIGFTYKLSPKLTIGGVYHTKTSLGNMKGDADVSFNANLANDFLDDQTFNASSAGTTALTIPVSGEISVKNFEWPETYGFGFSYQATDRLMVAMDYKRINWAAVMKDFSMSFVADSTQSHPMGAGFAGADLNATLYQDWDDQNVVSIGMAFKATDALTLRAGANIAGNPIPSALLNPLFPAIEKTHYTLGFGYAFDKSSDINFSVQYAPEVKDTIPDYLGSGTSVVVEHSQTSWQLMYSKRF